MMGAVVFSEGDVGCPPAQRRGVSLPLDVSSREKGKGWTGASVGIRKYCALVACAFSGGGSPGDREPRSKL